MSHSKGTAMNTGILDVAAIQRRLRAFSDARGWEPYQTPKNLAMAMVVEAGELVEIFQWMTPEQSQRVHANADLRGAIRWEDPQVEGEPDYVPRKRSDWACIVYSSGTGGRPNWNCARRGSGATRLTPFCNAASRVGPFGPWDFRECPSSGYNRGLGTVGSPAVPCRSS